MNKILLIIRREYLTRVRKKTFLISTILFPVLYFGLILGTGYITAKSGASLRIAIIDSSGYFDKGKIARENAADSSATLVPVSIAADSLKKNFSSLGYDGYVIVPADTKWEEGLKNLSLHTSRTLSIEGANPLERKLNNIWNSVKNEKLGIDESKKKTIENSRVDIVPENVNDQSANSTTASILGVVAAVLTYIILMLYGSQVMMGVMEEKTSRIAEVIVSSVKPFQLMLGKIVGIGLVALTQITLWLIAVFLIYNVTKASGTANSMQGMIGGMQEVFSSINVPFLLFFFLFYLLGGFFFYASLFAAVGSAVNEDMREAQSLSFPLMLPIIFSIATMQAVIKDPTGPLAVWGSIIPFTSPIYMMARIPFGVPGTVQWWELALSMFFMVGGFIFTTWFAGKIYRTGILMYGKKPSWKELIKWGFRKN
ncbi:MAG: ABC transporter permease [Chitinophagaceae bacterium]|nr:MAG: ABC transporter permease [Chitinophagaceae bacterium]